MATRSANDPIFQPLTINGLTLKNRVMRSSLGGRIDYYDGSMSEARLAWDRRFARGGVGAIISSNAGIRTDGIAVPGYASIDDDRTIPSWRALVSDIHRYDCRYIIQLHFSGRQRDLPRREFLDVLPMSATDKPDLLYGLRARRMTLPEIHELVQAYGRAARRAREAGADGVEIVACNGYLGNLVPALKPKILPIKNYILATEPLGEARARELNREDLAVHDSRFVVNYYRMTHDHRLLFGGGEVYGSRDPDDIKSFVRKYALAVYPQLRDARIEYGWGGWLALTVGRLPHLGRLSKDLYFAQGYSGQGVALSGLYGKLIAEAIAGTAERFDLFAAIKHRDFPGGALMRWPLQVMGMLWYSLRDRL